MPLDCEEKLNPFRLKRDGVHQGQRLLPPLDPSFAKVDEREPAHWMVFASRYARFLHFFEKTNTQTGDWEAFFQKDPALYLAVASIQNVDAYKSSLHDYFSFLLDLGNAAAEGALRQNFGNLLNCAGTLAWQLEQLQKALPDNIALKAVLKNLIAAQLAPAFVRLIRYYKAALASADVDLSAAPRDWEILGADIARFDTVLTRNFSKDWVVNDPADWATFSTALTADASVFGNPLPGSVFLRLNQAASHNLFTSIFDQFLKAYARAVAEAKRSLETALTGQDDHQPHYALFLAFLRLLTYARDHANTLTARHLDFYYREILQLKTKPAAPNEAHLLVELAKHMDSYLLRAGEILKAGKDSLGKDVFYHLAEDFVANRTKVAALKSVFQYSPKPTDLLPAEELGRLFASPVANSADGLGAELTTADKQWHPLANKIYKGENLDKVAMPKAEVGFMIASHYLWLREGNRTVTIVINGVFKKGETPETLADALRVELTGEKGWLTPTGLEVKKLSDRLQIKFDIEGDQPAVVPYLPKVHGMGFDPGLPVAKIWLKHSDDSYFYNDLNGIPANSVTLIVQVTGIKNLALSNDFGVLDPSKPFQPFGAIPKTKAGFIVGNREMFQKPNLSNVSLGLEWQSLSSPGSTTFDEPNPPVRLSFLKKGAWVGDTVVSVFQNSPVAISIPADAISPEGTGADEAFSVEKKFGFLRLRLSGNFGHEKFQGKLSEYLLANAAGRDFAGIVNRVQDEIDYFKDDSVGHNAQVTVEHIEEDLNAAPPPKPLPPYTPLIQSITLGYTASQTIPLTANSESAFNSRSARFYHLHPFGFTEEHAFLNDGQSPTLLPRFHYTLSNTDAEQCLPTGAIQPPNSGEPLENEAEFYIGITDLHPPQNIALLFQLAEGSANPKTLKPADHLRWSFLSKNQWVALKKDEVNDRTAQLIRSGIVTLSVPKGATNDNTRLPAGMHWLRASIARQTDQNGAPIPTTSDAVCKIIRVAAQATRAIFSDKGNAPDFLRSQLPAATIAKLLEPKAEVKKVEQPFPTFGGRPAELPEHFYTRISERLRHKNRAITAWDYERLVLEAFPHVFKVKCLNHTLFIPSDTGIGKYNELAPGHVSLIAIPDLRNHNAIDPLRPYVSLGDLEAIADFIKKHLSCHVNLHVHNPVFEPLRVEFCVKFHRDVDEAFHLKLLKTEIVRFLSPWAFDEGKEISFGGRVFKSSLINFVEERPYVDYLTDFQLFHLITDSADKDRSKIDREEIEASTAISILVSAAAEEHTVKAIPPTETDLASERCNC